MGSPYYEVTVEYHGAIHYQIAADTKADAIEEAEKLFHNETNNSIGFWVDEITDIEAKEA